MYFVWVQGLRGPEAQLWADEPVDGNGKPVKEALFRAKLSKDQQKLSFNELIGYFSKDEL